MPRLNSFFLPAPAWGAAPAKGDLVTLTGPEARHLLSVLRAKPGDEVRLFDGQGREGLFAIHSVQGKASAELQALGLTITPALATGITLAIGWNKSSRRDWLLEKAVELGAQGLLFWRSARSQGEPPAEPKDSWTDKLIQAAKQCGATWLPQLGCISGGLAGLLRLGAGFESRHVLWEGAEMDTLLRPETLTKGRSLVVIGPEGGLENAEAQALLQAGFAAASLGPRPLRWETAALHCLSLGYHALLANAEPATPSNSNKG